MSANNRTTLHEIDSSLWLNFIRYGIALNALLSNGFLLFLFIKYIIREYLREIYLQIKVSSVAHVPVQFVDRGQCLCGIHCWHWHGHSCQFRTVCNGSRTDCIFACPLCLDCNSVHRWFCGQSSHNPGIGT